MHIICYFSFLPDPDFVFPQRKIVKKTTAIPIIKKKQ